MSLPPVFFASFDALCLTLFSLITALAAFLASRSERDFLLICLVSAFALLMILLWQRHEQAVRVEKRMSTMEGQLALLV